MVKGTKSNNYGRGWFFQYEDGYRGWVLSLSEQEKQKELRKHGKLVVWAAA